MTEEEQSARLWCLLNQADYESHSLDEDGELHVVGILRKPIHHIVLNVEIGVGVDIDE